MTFLLDTDIVVSFLNGRSSAVDLIRHLQPEGIAISMPTYGEVLEGVYFGRDPARHGANFDRFLIGVELRPLTAGVMRAFAGVRGALRSRGLLIPDLDLLIAAPALEDGLTLATRNRRHFDRVPGLLLYEAS